MERDEFCSYFLQQLREKELLSRVHTLPFQEPPRFKHNLYSKVRVSGAPQSLPVFMTSCSNVGNLVPTDGCSQPLPIHHCQQGKHWHFWLLFGRLPFSLYFSGWCYWHMEQRATAAGRSGHGGRPHPCDYTPSWATNHLVHYRLCHNGQLL